MLTVTWYAQPFLSAVLRSLVLPSFLQAMVLIVGTGLSSARSARVKVDIRLSSKYSETGVADVEAFEQCQCCTQHSKEFYCLADRLCIS
jgi:hypothetical protein